VKLPVVPLDTFTGVGVVVAAVDEPSTNSWTEPPMVGEPPPHDGQLTPTESVTGEPVVAFPGTFTTVDVGFSTVMVTGDESAAA